MAVLSSNFILFSYVFYLKSRLFPINHKQSLQMQKHRQQIFLLYHPLKMIYLVQMHIINKHQFKESYNLMSTRSTKDKTVYEQKVTPRGEHYYKPYHLGRMLGKGGFATCYQIKYANDENKYAVKIIQKESQHHTKHQTVEKIKEEISLISSLDHPGIVKYIHDFEDNQNCYIILQLCTNGSLSDILKKRRYLTQPQIRYFLFQMVDIMRYIKQRNIIHRDIKLANYFLDEKFRLKLGDFGLATKNDELFRSKRKMCGTPNYIAPEIIEKKVYGFQVDTWSTGVLIFTLAFGIPPFETKTCKQTYERIKKCNYKFEGISKNITCSDDLKDFIKKILCLDPIRRLKIQDFTYHPFMNRYQIAPELQVTFPASPPSTSFSKKYSKIIRRRQGCSLKRQNSSTKQDATKIQYKLPRVTYKDALYTQPFIQKNIIKETQYITPSKRQEEEGKKEIFNDYFMKTPEKKEKNVDLKIQHNQKKLDDSFEEKLLLQKHSKGRKKFCSNYSSQLEQNYQTQKKIIIKKEKSIIQKQQKQMIDQQQQILPKYQPPIINYPNPKQQQFLANEAILPNQPIIPPFSCNWSRPSLTLKLRQSTIQNKQAVQKQIKIIHWINATQKYGIVYVLSSHQIGIYFNDASRMILTSRDQYFSDNFRMIHYIFKKGQQTIHKQISMNQVRNLQPGDKLGSKIQILTYYHKILRKKYQIVSSQPFEANIGTIPLHLKGYKMGNQLTVFKLSNNNIQFFFEDNSNIFLSFTDQFIVYQSQNGLTITNFLLTQKVDFQPDFVRKILIVFSFYGKWLPKNGFSELIESQRGKINMAE